MSIIEKVIPFEDYRLLIELGNGNYIILNFNQKIKTLRFSELENKDLFKKVYTDGFSIMWSKGKIKISMGEAIEMLQDIRSLFAVV